jgi:diketogulonate reductase-like aldo/keto reductase
MPLAAFGTWHYNDSWAKSGVVLAVEAGFRSIDTANDYFNQLGTGEGIGAAISAGGATREQLWVTSKVEGCGVPHPPHGTPVRAGHCHNDTLSVFEANLQLLKLPSVDLMLVHKPPPGGCGPENCASMQQQWAAFETMLAAGKARTIGVSNYCISCLECLAKTWKIVPAVNQIQLHVGMGADPEGLVSYCRARHIQIQAYSPLDVDQSNGTAELITGPLTNGIGRAHNKSGATVALKWLAQQAIPLVTKAHTMVRELPYDLPLSCCRWQCPFSFQWRSYVPRNAILHKWLKKGRFVFWFFACRSIWSRTSIFLGGSSARRRCEG